jgi:hypothetical protein
MVWPSSLSPAQGWGCEWNVQVCVDVAHERQGQRQADCQSGKNNCLANGRSWDCLPGDATQVSSRQTTYILGVPDDMGQY